jgi:hypothetical protein
MQNIKAKIAVNIGQKVLPWQVFGLITGVDIDPNRLRITVHGIDTTFHMTSEPN